MPSRPWKSSVSWSVPPSNMEWSWSRSGATRRGAGLRGCGRGGRPADRSRYHPAVPDSRSHDPGSGCLPVRGGARHGVGRPEGLSPRLTSTGSAGNGLRLHRSRRLRCAAIRGKAVAGALERVTELVDSVPLSWNSGMFCVRADVAREASSVHAPDVLRAFEANVAPARVLEGRHEWRRAGRSRVQPGARHFD